MEELSRAAGVLAPLAPAVTDPGDTASDAREAEAEAAGLGAGARDAEAEACSPERCRGDDGVAQATLLCSCLPQDWRELLAGWCVRPPVTTVTYFHLSAKIKKLFFDFSKLLRVLSFIFRQF